MKKLGLLFVAIATFVTAANAEDFKDVPTYVWKANIHASVPKRYANGSKRELCDYDLQMKIGETVVKNCNVLMSGESATATFKLTQDPKNPAVIVLTRTVDYINVPRGQITEDATIDRDNFSDTFYLRK